MLFSDRSIWTMAHGIGFGGAAMVGLAVTLYALWAARPPADRTGTPAEPRSLGPLATLTAAALWFTVIGGTYIVFPPYRATPPAGTTDLTAYPRALIASSPDTAWLHAFAMESKEHMPWIAAMLATAVAFVAVRYRPQLLRDAQVRKMAVSLLAVCLLLVSFVSLMGVFVNKVAPLW